jgi:hypothetical protein
VRPKKAIPTKLAHAGALGLTLLVAPPSAAEEARASDSPPRSYVDIDFTLLNAGVSGSGHVGSRVYLGGGASFFPAVSINSFAVYPIELVEGHGFMRWAPIPAFQVDAGVRGSYFQYLGICIFQSCTTTYGTLIGPYADVHLGSRNFKIGPRFAYAVTDGGAWGAMLYPLILRIQFTP